MSEYYHIVNVEGAVLKDHQLLIATRSEEEDHAGGLLSFIGGKVEFKDFADDPILTTLKREILEEVGVEICNPRYVTSTGFTADGGETVVNLVYLCDWQAGEPMPLEPEEVAEVNWMTFEAIRSHDKTPPWLLEYVEHIETMLR